VGADDRAGLLVGLDGSATTARRNAATTQDALLADFQLFHLEADLRWIDHTESRLAALAEEVRDVPDPRGR
jgi:hypothetical protein